MTSYLAALAFLKYAKGAQKLTAEARVRRAHDYLETAAAALPDRPEELINYAQVLLDKGNSQEALKLSTRATLLRKDLMEGWIIKGVAQRDVGKYGEARLTFLTVLRNQPERREVLYNLAILFMDHALDKKTGDEVCPDVSIDDMKQEVGSDLFEGVAVKHLKPQHVDTLRRLRQATKYLEQYKEQAELDFEQLAQVEKQVRTANQAIRRETKKRSRALKKEKRAKKKAARRKKKMEKERLKRETEEAERKMEEAAAAAAGDAQGGQGNAVDATVDPAAAMPPEPAPDVPPEPAPDVPPEPVSDVPPEPASEVPVEVAPDPAPAGGTDGEEKEEEKEEEKTSDSDSKKKEKLAPQEPEAAPSAGEEGSSADVQGADDAKEEK
jgi:tetratricopeptide (TPR) repeat protein